MAASPSTVDVADCVGHLIERHPEGRFQALESATPTRLYVSVRVFGLPTVVIRSSTSEPASTIPLKLDWRICNVVP